MKTVDADHTNRRVRDLQRSLRFYRDEPGLEPIGLSARAAPGVRPRNPALGQRGPAGVPELGTRWGVEDR